MQNGLQFIRCTCFGAPKKKGFGIDAIGHDCGFYSILFVLFFFALLHTGRLQSTWYHRQNRGIFPAQPSQKLLRA
jgi:hypothetical protein